MTDASSDEALLQKMDMLLRQSRQTNQNIERLLAFQIWDALGDDKVVEFPFEVHTIRFHVPDGYTDAIQRIQLQRRTFYEIRLLDSLRSRIPRDAVIVDAGAHIGNHTVYFAKVCDARAIHAFEPLPAMTRILTQNVALNALDQVTIHPFALGQTNGRADVSIFNPANHGSTHLTPSATGEIEIRPLDEFDIANVAFLKIDVEGMQDDLLRGAEDTIARCRPLMLIEAHPHGDERARTKELLDTLGYDAEDAIGPNLLAVPR